MPGDRPVSMELGTTGGRFPEGAGTTRRRTRSSVTDLALAGLVVIVTVAILVAAWPAPPPADPDLAVMVPATAVPDVGPSQAAPAVLVPDLVASPEAEPAVRTALVFGPPAMPSDAAGSDPADLPRFPGAQRTTYVEDRAGRVHSVRLEYMVWATPDAVRAYYREAMREHGWFVGEMAVLGGAWHFDANRGTREVTLGIHPTAGATDPATRVTLSVSDVVPQATPTPTQTPKATPKRTSRPRTQEAVRPRERVRITPRRDDRDERRRPSRRDDDDDDDGDGDDDDDGRGSRDSDD